MRSVAVVVVCATVFVTGLIAGIRWSGRSFRAPDATVELSATEAARRYVWYAAIVFMAGFGAGITVLGTGGRLAMRLLALTAGPAAQGRLTEADEVVGEITVGGTLGFGPLQNRFVNVAKHAIV